MSKIIAELMKKYNRKTVSILGTEYIILLNNPDENPVLKNLAGYCSNNTKELVINNNLEYFKGKTDEWIANDIKSTIRHELIHAFFNESGLVISAVYSDGWAKNEEMVDWWSVQSPKIFKTFTELELIELPAPEKRNKKKNK